jgi:hypothetical protein
VTENQAFRFIGRTLFLIAACLALFSCQGNQLPTIALPKAAAFDAPRSTFTRTPFQAQSPTLPPTSTATPVPTNTPTIVPTQTAEPCLSQQGETENYTLEFSNPALPLTFRVHRPPCFGKEEGYRYPVLYIIHGQTFKDDQWDRLGLDEAADALISAKEAAPFLIVMPLEVDTYENIYTASFSKDLIEGLVPWMDANYPTCADRTCRAIGGLSRGGAWALRLGFSTGIFLGQSACTAPRHLSAIQTSFRSGCVRSRLTRCRGCGWIRASAIISWRAPVNLKSC